MTCYTPTAGVEQYLNILLILLRNNIHRVYDLIYSQSTDTFLINSLNIYQKSE